MSDFQIFSEQVSDVPGTKDKQMLHEYGCDGAQHAELTTRLDLNVQGEVEYAEVVRSRTIASCTGGCAPSSRGTFRC